MTEDDIVEELNRSFAVVHTSSTYILMEKGGTDFVLDSKTSFLNLFENQIVYFNESKNPVTKAHVWLKNLKRRTFKNIVFNPKIVGHYEGNFNIYKGWTKQSVQGDCLLFWEHVEKIICSGNKTQYKYMRKWMAHLFQKPWIIGAAVVLRGKQGTGKGVFVNALGILFGEHYAPLASLDQILGRFNSHLKSSLLVYADEAIWGGNKKEIGALKALITEPKLFIEAKCRDGYWIDNFKHLIVSSNEDWAIHLDPDDRRFFVLDVSAERKEDHGYFAAIIEQLEHGGYEALLYDLLHENIEGFDPRVMPENYAGFDMKLASAPTIDQYVYAALKEGGFNLNIQAHPEVLKDTLIRDFYEYYKAWCRSEDLSIQTSAIIGKRLKVLLPKIKVVKAAYDEDPLRRRMYGFPSLKECRESFQELYKQDAQIWD